MTGSGRFCVAAAAYPLKRFTCLEDYRAKLEQWVRKAADEGAKLLVFPEYAGLEAEAAAGVDELVALHAELARAVDVHILAGSLPAALDDGRTVNRTWLVAPSGVVGFQDKRMITPWEREEGGIGSGSSLEVFETPFARIGVLVCYDAEFPLLARSLVEKGTDILLVPACTDTLAGYWRVRIACLARALEGQCYVVHATTVGEAPWSEFVDVNVGAAGIYAPADRGFPDDGVLAVGELNKPGWIYADLDVVKLDQVRRAGDVRGLKDWHQSQGVVS